MRQLAGLLRLGVRSTSGRTVPGFRVLQSHYLLVALALSLAFVAPACGSRVATPQPRATGSASASAQPTASVRIHAAQLVAESTGWVLSDDALSRTSDGGQTWADIIAPGVPVSAIRGVWFMDTRHGWAVSSSASDPAQLEISATSDGGSSWSTSDLGNPDPLLADSAPSYIDFVDAQHGWVAAMISSGAGVLPRGILFQTSDGGKTWQHLRMPVGGRVEFVSATTGWLADGDQGNSDPKFYVTSDGGQNWAPETVTPPAGFSQDQVTYTIPAFTSAADVVLAAFDNGTSATAGLYQTDDNGTSWQLKATVPAGNPAGDVSPSATIVDPTHWISVSVDGTSITDVTQDGAGQTSVTPDGLPNGAVGDASFTATGAGWVVTDTSQCAGFKTDCTETIALFGTSDGGAHWAQLAVPQGPMPSSASATAAS